MKNRFSWSSLFRFFARAVLCALLVCVWLGPAAGQTGLRIGDPFPKASLQDLDGNEVMLTDAAAGKIAIIHFWASWCPLCMREMSALEYAQKTYGEKGVVAYSIDAGETAEAAMVYVQKTDATYTILLDPTMAFTRQCGVLSIPTTFVCDREGKIRFKVLGEINRMGLEKLLSTLPR